MIPMRFHQIVLKTVMPIIQGSLWPVKHTTYFGGRGIVKEAVLPAAS